MKKIFSFIIASAVVCISLIGLVSSSPSNAEAQNIGSLRVITSTGFSFKKDLQLGDTDPDVLELQKVLNSDVDTIIAKEGPGSYGYESTYFGQLTKEAVIRFQNKYKDVILTPAGLTAGNGAVNKLTRTKLNLLIGVFITNDSVGVPKSRTASNSTGVISYNNTLVNTAITPQSSSAVCKFIELLINIGAIAPEKAGIARSAVKCNPPVTQSAVCQFVDLLININVIPGNKAAAARSALNCVSYTLVTIPDNNNISSSSPRILSSNLNFSTSSVVMSLTTNVATKADVTYRIGSTEAETVSYTNLVTSRTETITGLTPSTLYTFTVKIIDVNGNEYSSGNFNGMTLGEGFNLPVNDPALGGVFSINDVLGSTTKKNVITSTTAEETAGTAVQAGIGYPDIAVDTMNQPHVLAQVGLTFPGLDAALEDTSAGFNLYSKISGLWISIAPLVNAVGGPKRPEIEIDANDQAWISGMTFVSPPFVEPEVTPSGPACEATLRAAAQPEQVGYLEAQTTVPNAVPVGGFFKSIKYCEVRSNLPFPWNSSKDYWKNGGENCAAYADGQHPHGLSDYVDRNCRPASSSPGDAAIAFAVGGILTGPLPAVLGVTNAILGSGNECVCDVYKKVTEGDKGVIEISLVSPPVCKDTVASIYFDDSEANSITTFTNADESNSASKHPSVVGGLVIANTDGTFAPQPKDCYIDNNLIGNVVSALTGNLPRPLGTATEVAFDKNANSQAQNEAILEASSTAAEMADDELRIPYVGDWVGMISGISSSPTLNWFDMIRPWVNSFVGNVAIDPFVPDTAWHMGIQWPTPTTKFSAFGDYAPDRTLSPGNSGEKIIFRIAPQKAQAGIWHSAMGGSSKGASAYINATMSSPVVWADYNTYRKQGNDMSYVDLGIDWNNPKAAYIVSSYAGVVINVWNGTSMLFPNNSLYVVDANAADYGNGATRWSPKWTPALGGGAFLCWTSGDGNVKLKYISSAGVSSFGPTTTIGAGSQCNVATDYQGNVHVTYMKGGNVEYRKVITKTP